MPFRSETGGFTGDGNMGDFIDEVVETFLTDTFAAGGLEWISQITAGSPARGKGSSPNFEFIFSRGGVGTEAPPFWFMQTNSRTLRIYSGNGVDLNDASFDQPGNPVNEPNADPPSDITSGSFRAQRCLAVTSALGPYDAYWVFGGLSAEYCHVVLKVGPRQYRHFHIGMLTPFDTSLDADTFYVTNHRWSWLGPDNLRASTNESNTNNKEHAPYEKHLTPFGNCNGENVAVGVDGRSQGMWLYSPNYGTEGYDWWFMTGDPINSNPSGGGGGAANLGEWQNTNQPGNVRSVLRMSKSVGVVNTNLESPLFQVRFGTGFVGGYGDAVGSIPWACEPTFTTDGVPLIPIVVGLMSDFESGLRAGPVGVVPDVFRVNMKSLDPEQEISIGSDTYVVFPMINKDANNTLDNEGYSGYEGLAYKKITADAS
jgi:hypothetical protein